MTNRSFVNDSSNDDRALLADALELNRERERAMDTPNSSKMQGQWSRNAKAIVAEHQAIVADEVSQHSSPMNDRHNQRPSCNGSATIARRGEKKAAPRSNYTFTDKELMLMEQDNANLLDRV